MLPITAGDADAVRSLPGLARHDPFDRVLLAQAVSHGLQLVTADRALLALQTSIPAAELVDATA